MTRPVLKKPIPNFQSKALPNARIGLQQQNHDRLSQSKSKPELRVQVLRKNLEGSILKNHQTNYYINLIKEL
jgi:hypothetical protein